MVSLGGWFFEFGIEGCGLRGSGPVTGVVVKKDSGSRLLPIPPGWKLEGSGTQASLYGPVRPNRRGPVPVYRTGLVGNRSKPVEVKFEFKSRSANGLYRLTGRFDRFTGRFDW